MKDLQALKQAFKTVKSSRLRGEDRVNALQAVWNDTKTFEKYVAFHPTFLGFYEVGELRHFINELQKALGL